MDDPHIAYKCAPHLYSALETLSIPSELDGHKVTALGTYSFSYYFPTGVKSVIIPEGVVSIGDSAFSCNNRETTSLVLSSTLETIGSGAFSGCVDCTFYGYPGSTLDTLVNKYLTTRMESVMGEDGSWSEQEVSTGNKFADIANAPGAETPSESGDAGAEQTGDGVFSDVAEGIWYAEPVNWAVENGVTNGTSDTTFSPDTTCNRARIVTFLYRAFAE